MPKYDDFMDIVTILDDYSKNIYEEIRQASMDVAKEGKNILKKTSPKRTGDYSKGWKVKSTSNLNDFSSTIYNSTDWQLTHLLEKGHVNRNGSRTRAIKHIEPVEKKCIDEYYQEVTNIIKRGA